MNNEVNPKVITNLIGILVDRLGGEVSIDARELLDDHIMIHDYKIKDDQYIIRTKKRKCIIIVEGPQGVGKTTITNYIREKMTYTNLYRLSGHDDPSADGLNKSLAMYDGFMDYIQDLNRQDIMNIIMDRSFITEQVYCKLGYREYDFTHAFDEYAEKLGRMDNVIIINLQIRDKEKYKERLMRDKKQHNNIEFNVENSIKQQAMYDDIMRYLDTRYGIAIHNIATDNLEHWQTEIQEIIK